MLNGKSNSRQTSESDDGARTGSVYPDILLALGLVAALGVVFVADALTANESLTTEDPDAGVILTETEIPASDVEFTAPSIAVTPAQYDDMEKLLVGLGAAYKPIRLSLNEFVEPERLNEVEILFLTCGTVPEEWLGKLIGKGTRPGTEVREFRPEYRERIDRNIREFVENGGTLYASDWRYSLVASAFPEFVDGASETTGHRQDVVADVLDSGLIEVLGDRIDLKFDKPGWSPAAFRGDEVTTYLRGTFNTMDGKELSAPLLVKFPVGDGAVIFTSFHNEKLNSETAVELLRYLVFTVVTAKSESQVKRTMVQGGFSPEQQSLLTAQGGKMQVTKKYQCAAAADLKFALGFESRGAKLKLEVTSPQGKTVEKQGTQTFHIDIEGAAAGEWKYKVTALEVPYKNFPFTVTVGAKQ